MHNGASETETREPWHAAEVTESRTPATGATADPLEFAVFPTGLDCHGAPAGTLLRLSSLCSSRPDSSCSGGGHRRATPDMPPRPAAGDLLKGIATPAQSSQQVPPKAGCCPRGGLEIGPHRCALALTPIPKGRLRSGWKFCDILCRLGLPKAITFEGAPPTTLHRVPDWTWASGKR
jgi:hypothetical protein